MRCFLAITQIVRLSNRNLKQVDTLRRSKHVRFCDYELINLRKIAFRRVVRARNFQGTTTTAELASG
jgi:hypothetical protein